MSRKNEKLSAAKKILNSEIHHPSCLETFEILTAVYKTLMVAPQETRQERSN